LKNPSVAPCPFALSAASQARGPETAVYRRGSGGFDPAQRAKGPFSTAPQTTQFGNYLFALTLCPRQCTQIDEQDLDRTGHSGYCEVHVSKSASDRQDSESRRPEWFSAGRLFSDSRAWESFPTGPHGSGRRGFFNRPSVLTIPRARKPVERPLREDETCGSRMTPGPEPPVIAGHLHPRGTR